MCRLGRQQQAFHFNEKKGQPHLHSGLATGQPQSLQQVALLLVTATRGPHVLYTLSQNHGRTERQLETESDRPGQHTRTTVHTVAGG